jgi:hypothetical protein
MGNIRIQLPLGFVDLLFFNSQFLLRELNNKKSF